jgi:hypothetical protein
MLYVRSSSHGLLIPILQQWGGSTKKIRTNNDLLSLRIWHEDMILATTDFLFPKPWLVSI